MSTLKLNKPAVPADQKREKSVRRMSPELRDRSKAPEIKKSNQAVIVPEDVTQTPPPRKEMGARKEHAAGKRPGSKPAYGAARAADDARRRDKPHDQESRAFTPKPAARPVRTVPDADAQPRLSKVMADRGLCSRREADDWIVNGWVKVNGEIVETLGTRIDADAEIVVSAYAKEHQAENVTILLHKPIGYVSGQAEDGYEPAVVLVKSENQWAEDPTQKAFRKGFLHGLAPAGRLDIDSTGLLVLTQDGRVARQLIGDDSTTEKEYLVRVEGQLSANGLAKLNHGLSLDGVQLKPAKVSWQNEDQLRFVLREGRKRQIRRMCELVGLKVVGLKRIRIGRIALGKLPPGQWRYLGAHERF